MNRIDKIQIGVLCLVVLAAGAAHAEDEERRIVKKVRIHCEAGDCEGHGGGGRTFSWFSSDGPAHFGFAGHLGGGFLGVTLTDLTPELRAHFGVGEDEGVMISRVLDDSAAMRAGLEVGDIVTAVDGERIGSGSALARAIRRKEEGDTALLEVWRDGSVQNISASVEEREGLGHAMEHAFALDCEGEDCDPHLLMGHGLELECDEGPCRIEVECDGDGSCVCTVDGAETECGRLHEKR